MAPPGGCRQRSGTMSAMANPTATAPAHTGSGISAAQNPPTRADKVLPPSTGQGWASGLDGMPNTSTALAPSEATIQGPALPPPAHQRLSQAVNSTPTTAPAIKRNRSRPSMPSGAGQKWRSQRAMRVRPDGGEEDGDGGMEKDMGKEGAQSRPIRQQNSRRPRRAQRAAAPECRRGRHQARPGPHKPPHHSPAAAPITRDREGLPMLETTDIEGYKQPSRSQNHDLYCTKYR